MQDMLPLLLASSTSSVAAFWDTRTGRIPNRLTLSVIAAGPLLHLILGGLPQGLFSVAGVVGCGFVPCLVHRLTRGQALGGGDVKLFAALGACVGVTTGLEVQFLSYLIVCVFALGQLTWRGRLLGCLRSALRLLINPILPTKWRRDVPPELLTLLRMGPAICAATLIIGAAQLSET